MTDTDLMGRAALKISASTALKASAQLWFLVAAIGHWVFLVYIVGYYAPLLVPAGVEGLREEHLYVAGDTIGNLAMAAHLVLAVIIIGGGPLQFIPQIRSRTPAFHRWLGRAYILAAATSSIGGLYVVWSRPLVSTLLNSVGGSLSGVLVVLFAAIALRYAMAGNIRIHRRWALRLFMVASAVWFYRLGFSLWPILTGGVGMDLATFSGPFFDVWGFGQYLLPLAALELYFFASDRPGATSRFTVATVVFGLTVLMSVGIFAATINMWLPRL